MKKDSVYSLRINSKVLEALRREANRNRRTMSSLIDSIIADYLESNDLLPELGFSGDQRRFPRVRVNLSGTTTVTRGTRQEDHPCVVLDLSLGGVLLAFPKGSVVRLVAEGAMPSFELSFQIPQTGEELHFHCQARHISDNGDGLKVGAVFQEPAAESLAKLEAYLD